MLAQESVCSEITVWLLLFPDSELMFAGHAILCALMNIVPAFGFLSPSDRYSLPFSDFPSSHIAPSMSVVVHPLFPLRLVIQETGADIAS